ncbi:Alpha/beta hydrolase fold-1 [Artemisia annua]|uniref:Alpha/beta hydrolase fold-1 n=1 Tax=Artemisia annua TaxID=35608 RepID=A0A2U1PKP9_ARTAN|nr:Alpha/beta hydrolase fold-1 [Artemisia annua]
MGNIFVVLTPLVHGLVKLVAGLTPQTIEIEPGTTMNIWVPKGIVTKKDGNIVYIPPTKHAIVLLHAFAMDGILTWFLQVLALSREYSVYVPDLLICSLVVRSPIETKGQQVSKPSLRPKMAKLYLDLVKSFVASATVIELTESISVDAYKRLGLSTWSDLLMPTTVEGLEMMFSVGLHKLPWIPKFIYRDFLEKQIILYTRIWMVLMGLRDRIRNHVINKIGNGKDVSIWYDIWGETDRLCNIIPKAARYAARLSDNLSVADMIDNGCWKWPEGWIQSYPHLASIKVPILNDDASDEVLWKKSNGDIVEFSIKVAWEDMRPTSQKVKWEKLVWYSQGIPRHSFKLPAKSHPHLHPQFEQLGRNKKRRIFVISYAHTPATGIISESSAELLQGSNHKWLGMRFLVGSRFQKFCIISLLFGVHMSLILDVYTNNDYIEKVSMSSEDGMKKNKLPPKRFSSTVVKVTKNMRRKGCCFWWNTFMVEELRRCKADDADLYILRFYNRLDEEKKGEESRKWMEAFDQPKTAGMDNFQATFITFSKLRLNSHKVLRDTDGAWRKRKGPVVLDFGAGVIRKDVLLPSITMSHNIGGQECETHHDFCETISAPVFRAQEQTINQQPRPAEGNTFQMPRTLSTVTLW